MIRWTNSNWLSSWSFYIFCCAWKISSQIKSWDSLSEHYTRFSLNFSPFGLLSAKPFFKVLNNLGKFQFLHRRRTRVCFKEAKRELTRKSRRVNGEIQARKYGAAREIPLRIFSFKQFFERTRRLFWRFPRFSPAISPLDSHFSFISYQKLTFLQYFRQHTTEQSNFSPRFPNWKFT
jgi:hypothetical protein